VSRGFGGKSAAGKPFAGKSQSFRPRRRFGAAR
jgi:hypothetical protein